MNPFTPHYAPIPQWCAISGMGRTRTYEEAGKGNIRIIKVGGRSLVDVPHGLAWLRSLPEAKLGRAHRQQSAAA
jgi:hypothetical protein